MKTQLARFARSPRSAKRPTWNSCRICGGMMIQDPRGGEVCVNGPHTTPATSFTGQRELVSVERGRS